MSPDFAELSRLEEQVLAARLDAIRASISHAGEKGRALEQAVRKVLRELLPPEYGLTTGFVASIDETGAVQLSTQLDIIIYDAIRHSPVIHLESCDVMPLEAVYGYVEVKATLTSTSDDAEEFAENSIESCIAKNIPIRALNQRVFNITAGSPISTHTIRHPWLAPRAYVVAFDVSGATAKDPDAFAARMAQVLKRNRDAHLHGVLVPTHGFFYTRAVDVRVASDDDYFHVLYTKDHPTLAFKSVLLRGLSNFQRAPEGWAPALDQYFAHKGQWHEKSHKVT